MNNALLELSNALNDISLALINGWSDDRTLREVYGWNCPALSRHDLADIPATIASRIRTLEGENIPAELQEKIEEIPYKLSLLKTDTLAQLYNGNAVTAAPAIILTFQWIDNLISPIFSWENLQDSKAIPHQLAKKLRNIKLEIDELTPNKEELKNQITLIKEATEAAESLPTDLHALSEARTRIQTISDDAVKLFGAMEKREKDTSAHEISINSHAVEAEKLVQQCEEAYRITTTKGLAAGFDLRAGKLASSMWVWVAGLVIALSFGAWSGSNRISKLSEALLTSDPKWEIITAQAVLSFLSVGAPLWFAWVSTKQISQRFRLAEDYAFKATVAKAYEGYRKEAARIDETFEARLFNSALTRLEEAPLRLVENDNHNSPWSEFFASPAFQKALETIPSLKDKFIEISKAGVTALSQDRREVHSKPPAAPGD